MVLADSHRISRVLWYLGAQSRSQRTFAYRAFTFCGGTSQNLRLEDWFLTCRPRTHRDQLDPTTPSTQRVRAYVPTGLGCSPFARRYWGNHFCFLFLGLMRCFSSPRWLRSAYAFSRAVTGHDSRRVSPFGHLRIKVCLPLPGAFRSLPRPSSPSRAKASTMRP